jgi:hypothetical protein
MSLAFDNFLRQYNATGSEKADGYSRDAFEGLTDPEKDTVFNMLEKELPYSAEWLFFLDPQKALAVCEKTESSWRGDGYKHVFVLQSELLRHTGDLKYQKHMIEDYFKYSERLRAQVADSLGRTPVSAQLIDSLRSIISVETNENAIARASFHLVKLHGVPAKTEEEKNKFWRYVADLRSESDDKKAYAMKDLARNYQIS